MHLRSKLILCLLVIIIIFDNLLDVLIILFIERKINWALQKIVNHCILPLIIASVGNNLRVILIIFL